MNLLATLISDKVQYSLCIQFYYCLPGLKAMAKVKVFFKSQVKNFKVKVTYERSCHKKYTYENLKLYLL